MYLEVFRRAGRRLRADHPDDEPGRMLRSEGLKTGGRFYAFATSSDVVVKLPAARVAELIATGAGAPCEPRPGRPMRQWVRVAPADECACLAVLIEAREFVADGGGGRA